MFKPSLSCAGMNSLCNKTKALIAITERYEPSQFHTHRAGIMTCHTFAINSVHDLKIQNHLDIQNSESWTLSSNFGFTGLASRQLQSGKSMMCAWTVVDKSSVIFAGLYPRILVPGSLREKLYCVHVHVCLISTKSSAHRQSSHCPQTGTLGLSLTHLQW